MFVLLLLMLMLIILTFVASDTDISAYDADVAISILHLLLYCSFSSSVFDSATAAAGTISLIGGWPCTALRAQ